MGGTEHSPELCADPARTSVRTKLCAASRLGRRCPPRLRTSRDAPAGGEDCRLRCGGLAVGPVWLIPAPVWQISGQRNASCVTACARDERKLWSDAPTGLLCRCGRLHLAGTKGIHVFSVTVVILLVGVMSLSLCLFVRGKSPIQPPEPVARVLHF